MEYSIWYKRATEKLEKISLSSDKKIIRKYRLGFLKKMINRLEEFSNDGCNNCNSLKENVNQLLTISEHSSKNIKILKEYKLIFQEIVNHLKKDHGLIEEGIYTGQWMIIGLSMGVAFETLTSIIPIGIPIGFVIGLLIGSGLDADAKKKGKVI